MKESRWTWGHLERQVTMAHFDRELMCFEKVMAAFPSFILSSFNCYCWTSITILARILSLLKFWSSPGRKFGQQQQWKPNSNNLIGQNVLRTYCSRKKMWIILTTRMGFEPTRAGHIGLAVQRLNHSATSSVGWQTFQFNVVKSRLKHVLQPYVQSEETVWLYTIKSGRGAGAFQTVACNDNRTYLCLVSEYQKLHRYIND